MATRKNKIEKKGKIPIIKDVSQKQKKKDEKHDV